MPTLMNRRALLGSGALLVASAYIPARAAAAPPPDGDLAFARVLVAVELLAADFYGTALAAGRFGRETTSDLKRALADEQRHYELVAATLGNAGQIPAVADDIDFAYPKGSFDTRGSIAKLGVKLETIALGAYLGAIGAYQTDSLKLPAAQIAANEAQHRSVFTALVHGQRIGPAFAAPLAIDAVSNALDAYTS